MFEGPILCKGEFINLEIKTINNTCRVYFIRRSRLLTLVRHMLVQGHPNYDSSSSPYKPTTSEGTKSNKSRWNDELECEEDETS